MDFYDFALLVANMYVAGMELPNGMKVLFALFWFVFGVGSRLMGG